MYIAFYFITQSIISKEIKSVYTLCSTNDTSADNYLKSRIFILNFLSLFLVIKIDPSSFNIL
jgi:hypothetical protein